MPCGIRDDATVFSCRHVAERREIQRGILGGRTSEPDRQPFGSLFYDQLLFLRKAGLAVGECRSGDHPDGFSRCGMKFKTRHFAFQGKCREIEPDIGGRDSAYPCGKRIPGLKRSVPVAAVQSGSNVQLFHGSVRIPDQDCSDWTA